MSAGARPTALAFGSYANERCAVAVVLDGHHKLVAAVAAGLLVFLSSRHGDTRDQTAAGLVAGVEPGFAVDEAERPEGRDVHRDPREVRLPLE